MRGNSIKGEDQEVAAAIHIGDPFGEEANGGGPTGANVDDALLPGRRDPGNHAACVGHMEEIAELRSAGDPDVFTSREAVVNAWRKPARLLELSVEIEEAGPGEPLTSGSGMPPEREIGRQLGGGMDRRGAEGRIRLDACRGQTIFHAGAKANDMADAARAAARAMTMLPTVQMKLNRECWYVFESENQAAWISVSCPLSARVHQSSRSAKRSRVRTTLMSLVDSPARSMLPGRTATVTSCPSASRCLRICRPTKPLAPVRKTLLMRFCRPDRRMPVTAFSRRGADPSRPFCSVSATCRDAFRRLVHRTQMGSRPVLPETGSLRLCIRKGLEFLREGSSCRMQPRKVRTASSLPQSARPDGPEAE